MTTRIAEYARGMENAKSPAGRLNRIILLAAAAFLLNAVATHTRPTEARLIKTGDPMASFDLVDTEGERVSMKGLLGLPVVFFFYADWCPCSHDSAAYIRRLRADNEARGVRVVAVGIQDEPADLRRFAERHSFGFPTLAGVGADDMAMEIGVMYPPTTLFVGADGLVRHVFKGKIERYAQLEEGVARMLGDGPAAEETDG